MRDIYHLLSSTWIAKIIRFPLTSSLAYLLGPQAFGAWVFFELVRAYVSIIGLNYGVLFDQYAPTAYQEKNWKLKLSPLYTTSLTIQLIQAFLFCLVLYIYYPEFVINFSILPRWAILALPLIILFETQMAYYQACLKTSLQFEKFSRQYVVISIVDITYIVPAYLWGVDGMLVAAPVLSVLKMYVIRSYAKFFVPEIAFSAFDLRILINNFKSATTLSISRIGNLLIRRYDPSLILYFLGVPSLGMYALASSFSAVVLDVSHAIATYLGPKLLIQYGKDETQEINGKHLEVLLVSVGILGCLSVIIIYSLAGILIVNYLDEYIDVLDYLALQSQYFNLLGASYIVQKFILAEHDYTKNLIFQATLLALNFLVFGFALLFVKTIVFALASVILTTFIVIFFVLIYQMTLNRWQVFTTFLVLCMAIISSVVPFQMNFVLLFSVDLNPTQMVIARSAFAITLMLPIIFIISRFLGGLSFSRLFSSLKFN